MKCRCTSCSGNKKIMKLGMVMGECGACKGTGTQTIEDSIIPDVAKPTDKDVINDAKREELREVKKTDSKVTSNQTKRKR